MVSQVQRANCPKAVGFPSLSALPPQLSAPSTGRRASTRSSSLRANCRCSIALKSMTLAPRRLSTSYGSSATLVRRSTCTTRSTPRPSQPRRLSSAHGRGGSTRRSSTGRNDELGVQAQTFRRPTCSCVVKTRCKWELLTTSFGSLTDRDCRCAPNIAEQAAKAELPLHTRLSLLLPVVLADPGHGKILTVEQVHRLAELGPRY